MTSSTTLVEVLQKYVDTLQQAPQVYEGSDLASLTRVYSELCKLVQDPFALFDLYDFMQAWDIEGYPPEPVQKIIETVQQEFTFGNSSEHSFLSKARQSLTSLKKWCQDKDNYPHSLESRLLAFVAESLLEHLESIQEAQIPAYVDVYLSPSLDLECLEEEEDGVSWCVELPVALTNRGGQIAAGVNLLLTLDKPTMLQQNEENFEKCADGKWRHIVGSIGSGQTKVIDIPVKHTLQGEIDIDVEYLKDISSSPEKEKKQVSYILPIPKNKIGLDCPNPYIPDHPLTSEWHWNNMVKGNHHEIVEDIMLDIESPEDPEHVYIVRGLRRTGKTSTLEGLRWQLNEGDNYLSVYIDFYRWFRMLHSKGVSLDDNKALLYEIACATAREARRIDIDIDFSKYLEMYDGSVNADHEEIEQLQMDFDSLNNFIGELSRKSCRKVVFLLDELDWCIRARELLGQGEKLDQLIDVMSALAMNENCTAILAHEWPTKEWEEAYQSHKMFPIYKNTQFLEVNDLRELAKLMLPDYLKSSSSPLYTEMAIQYIWRITGGWPGLAQLIFYWIFEDIDKQEKILINVSMVKGVVNDILKSKEAEAREFITYLLGSFDAEEILFLEKLSSKILQESSVVPGIQRVGGRFAIDDSIGRDNSGQILERLAGEGGKQIIEPVNEEQSQFRLRVGLLSYPEALALYQS